MSPSPLIKKLVIRPGQRVRVVNPPQGFLDLLADLPDGAGLVSAGTADCLILFAHDSAELRALTPAALADLVHDGLCWLAYPKKSAKTSSDLSREAMWALMEGSGLQPVSQIAIDEVWLALRFRPIS